MPNHVHTQSHTYREIEKGGKRRDARSRARTRVAMSRYSLAQIIEYYREMYVER